MNNLRPIFILVLLLSMSLTSCAKEEPSNGGEDIPSQEVGIHKYKAPLYWSIYEYCWNLEKAGVQASDMDFNSRQWDEVLNWMSQEMLPHGYDMVCTDGFIPMHTRDNSVYMTHYGSMSLSTLASKCKAKGLKLGVYDNPLWIHCSDDKLIPGTNITVGSLRYNPATDKVAAPNASDTWFSWIVPSHPGAKEYIDGFFKHFAQLGVTYIRMDFLSWFEDGTDRGMGRVGRGYGRDNYELALKYISESAEKYGIFTSLVMPHLYNSASLEAQYGHMARIVADTGNGTWHHFSDADRGKSFGTWPNCNNMFDGFIYWSKVSGRNKMILDGDFTRLNTFASDAECQSVISLQLLAGGPISIADQPSTIGNRAKFYQNDELLALNADRFVGKPLNASLISPNNAVWYGSMTNGDVVVGIFNRDNSSKTISVNLSDLGISGSVKCRDLWLHSDEGSISGKITATLGAHACKIVKLSK